MKEIRRKYHDLDEFSAKNTTIQSSFGLSFLDIGKECLEGKLKHYTLRIERALKHFFPTELPHHG